MGNLSWSPLSCHANNVTSYVTTTKPHALFFILISSLPDHIPYHNNISLHS